MRLSLNAIKTICNTNSIKKVVKINPEQVYERTKSAVENIPESKINEIVREMFVPVGVKSNFLSKIEELKKTTAQMQLPEDVLSAFKTIEVKATTIANKTETLNRAGKKVKPYLNNDFCKRYKKELETIKKYFEEQAKKNSDLGFASNDSKYFAESNKYYDSLAKLSEMQNSRLGETRITEIADGILPKNNIFYHGTKKGQIVTKEGFSPYKNNQLDVSPRECGTGVYLTPDKAVAAYFAGIKGRILPVKAGVKNTAYVTQDKQDALTGMINSLLYKEDLISPYHRDKFSNAITELTMRRVYKTAGYDSVYTPNGFGGGLKTSIDNFIGRKQSQLVIFDDNNTKIVTNKNFKNKLTDEFLQINAKFQSLLSTMKFVKKNPAEALMNFKFSLH